MILNLETIMANLSFCLLFFTMLFYWVFTGFSQNKQFIIVGTLSMLFSNISLFILLIIRWKESGHFPLSNLYESLLFLSWSLTTIHLILENLNPFSQQKSFTNTQQNQSNIVLIGAITAPSALLTNAFATFSLPSEMQKASALVPALQSNWLIMHVTIMILSYAALICGCLLSIAFLIITRGQEGVLSGNSLGNYSASNSKSTPISTEKEEILNSEGVSTLLGFSAIVDSSLNYNTVNPTSLDNSISSSNKLLNKKNFLNRDFIATNLDNLSYRILGIGFPLLTIGILSGSVWANEAWGSYWSWDPKETWALLTWLVFAIYLHTRLTKGWQGKKPAIIASFGFIIVWICFIGVNLLGKGLHSYGWIQNL
uniref:Cytochrome c biogenesis protein CcsA n=1 Tax=Schizomeris leibleinii TaxID=104533 RepID=F8SYE7_9CHLO|nr:heme attachment to plastid cytochrome c [Schizomeris leibleinii]AEH05353.1 heme attachment to plastid cytochrome c [Schizomeris leibleinii]